MATVYPKRGDIIVSPKFAFAYQDREGESALTVDGRSTNHIVHYVIGTEERLRVAAETGNPNPPRERVVDLGAYDPDRGKRKFVVVRAEMEGGGVAMAHDVYPDGLHISAMSLDEDGSIDLTGEVIKFFMSGAFTCMVYPSELEIVGHIDLI